MVEAVKERVARLVEEGYSFDLGGYISQGSSLVQKNLGGFIGFTLLYFVIQLVGSMIPFIGSLATSIVGPALVAGYFIVANKMQKNDPSYEFGDFFKGFPDLLQLFLVALVTGLLIVLSLIPMFIYFGSSMGEMFIDLLAISDDPIAASEFDFADYDLPATWQILLFGLLFMIPAIYLGISYALAPMFVIFGRLQFWDAMESSRKLVAKQWFSFFGFFFVCGLINLGGALLLFVGLLFTIPLTQCAAYAVYNNLVGTGSGDEDGYDLMDDITEHLVE